MAEFCLECFNKEFGENFTKKDVVLCEDLCEGCVQVKPCVMRVKNRYSIFRIFDCFR